MTQKKKDLIRDVAKLIDNMPENKRERAIGIMQGMILASEDPSDKNIKETNAHG